LGVGCGHISRGAEIVSRFRFDAIQTQIQTQPQNRPATNDQTQPQNPLATRDRLNHEQGVINDSENHGNPSVTMKNNYTSMVFVHSTDQENTASSRKRIAMARTMATVLHGSCRGIGICFGSLRLRFARWDRDLSASVYHIGIGVITRKKTSSSVNFLAAEPKLAAQIVFLMVRSMIQVGFKAKALVREALEHVV
jgi:hypothetical protein